MPVADPPSIHPTFTTWHDAVTARRELSAAIGVHSAHLVTRAIGLAERWQAGQLRPRRRAQ